MAIRLTGQMTASCDTYAEYTQTLSSLLENPSVSNVVGDEEGLTITFTVFEEG